MTGRDWDQDFDLVAWQALSAKERATWLGDGVIFWDPDVRDRVLSALLANVGLRRTLRLAPRALWVDVIGASAASAAFQRALADDRAVGTNTARWQPTPPPQPVMRPEFVARDESGGLRTSWARNFIAAPFYRVESTELTSRQGARVLQIGYLEMGEHTLARSDLLVLRSPWRGPGWPSPEQAELVVEISADPGDLAFDWQVRRPAYFAAGVEEVWAVDLLQQRVLRDKRGQEPVTITYAAHQPSTLWTSMHSESVEVDLSDVFGRYASRRPANVTTQTDFATWREQELIRLQRFETPWTIGHIPQWFKAPIGELLGGRFKDEVWQGNLFGSEARRDAVLSGLLANAGLSGVVQLAPLELWQQALAEDNRAN